ncbi:Lsr2 family protein [Streptomyces sp. NPDC088785]|uniref:histone-like nucleoid-structuring protein Lsr2 n=1 Tax=Streptomyces sp. NPDC088785 TaxID=3365897 RepID=UPI00380127B0
MAQRVVVTLFDDIDGSEAAETVAFGLDGRSYEIDLNQAHAKQLRKALAPYLQAGRKRNGRAARTDRTAKVFTHTSVSPDPAAVRAWARSNHLDVPPRGRIPKRIYEEFAKAN